MMITISPLCTTQSIFNATLGGVSLGLLCASHLHSTGKVLPSSSFASPLLTLGMVLGGYTVFLFHNEDAVEWNGSITSIVDKSLSLFPLHTTLLASIFIGAGSRLGRGCTSGNGIQGISSLSLASLAHVVTFMIFGVATATVLNTSQFLLRNKLAIAISVAASSSTPPTLHLPPTHLLLLSLIPSLLNFSSKKKSKSPPNKFFQLLTGMSFASSLTIANMISPTRVVTFLQPFSGEFGWDPSLMFVMVGAIATTMVCYYIGGVEKSGGEDFAKWRSRKTDMKTLLGGALFGIGWGMCGICPGPGLTNVGFAEVNAIVWVGGLVTSGQVVQFILGKQSNDKLQ